MTHFYDRYTKDFVTESNKIEGINREPKEKELIEFRRFMQLPKVAVEDLQHFVKIYQPNAQLRDRSIIPGVRVGNHIAPESGKQITSQLNHLLFEVNEHNISAYNAHIIYETLHPFTDGNGRSGRMLWAWQVKERSLGLGFLHMFYYQTLDNSTKKFKNYKGD